MRERRPCVSVCANSRGCSRGSATLLGGRESKIDVVACPWCCFVVPPSPPLCVRGCVRGDISGDIARRSGGAMTTRGEWARSRRCCSGIARSVP